MSLPIDGITPESLPPNQIWDKDQAPAERIDLIQKQMNVLEKDVFTAMHKDKVSPEEIQMTKNQLVDLQGAVRSSQPSFPAARLPENVEIQEREDFHTDVRVDIYHKDQNEITAKYKDAVNSLDNLGQKVIKSLETPGPSTKETDGWAVFKQPVDEVVQKLFNRTKDDLGYLHSQASQIKEKGNTVVIDIDAQSDNLHSDFDEDHDHFPHPPRI